MKRVADMLCTGHAGLRDFYRRFSLAMDIAILLLSAWVAILSLIDPVWSEFLTPWKMNPTLWTGLLGIGVFLLTLFQFKTDWKGKSEAHSRSFQMYSEVKREAAFLLANAKEVSVTDLQRLANRYDMASDVGAGIPEVSFLKYKRIHLLKVALSKHLDAHPGAFLWLTRLKWVLRDNFQWKKKVAEKDPN